LQLIPELKIVCDRYVYRGITSLYCNRASEYCYLYEFTIPLVVEKNAKFYLVYHVDIKRHKVTYWTTLEEARTYLDKIVGRGTTEQWEIIEELK